MADVLPSHSVHHTITGGGFSPLTLFESTITNAQMLVESMAERELFSALRIIGGLHSHVVHVMEPRYGRLCERSDHLAELEAAGVTQSPAAAAAEAASATPSGHRFAKEEKLMSESDLAAQQSASVLRSALGTIKKLARRQKSFELLATSLSTDKFDKYRIILSRDYTSSDEEADIGAAGGSGEDGGALRVRELPWESAELREMKQQLDSIFLENCATQKQSQQLRGTVRDPGCVSGRTPPANCPSWALAAEYR